MRILAYKCIGERLPLPSTARMAAIEKVVFPWISEVPHCGYRTCTKPTAASNPEGLQVETPLSHLAHLEITTPDVEASARFYEEKFGMRIIDRVAGNVYLRCWGDYYRYSLVITEGPEASLGRMAWRTELPGSARGRSPAHRSHRRAGHLDRRRPRLRQGLRVHRPLRPPHAPVLRCGKVRGRARLRVHLPGPAGTPQQPRRRTPLPGPRHRRHAPMSAASPSGTTRPWASASWRSPNSMRPPSRCSPS